MNNYSALLNRMMDAILTGDANPADVLLRDKENFSAQAQLNVYIEGYRLRLGEALENAYPALLHYWGKEKFAALAEDFIASHPPRHFNLDTYAIGFAAYAASACEDAFACELALLEEAIHEVYQAQETPAMEASWLRQQGADSLGNMPLRLRAALRLLAFDFPAEAYLSALRAGENPVKPPQKQNRLAVLRHRHRVRRLPLEQGEHVLLCLLNEGLTLAEALEDVRLAPCIERGDFAVSLQGWLARWVSEGMLRSPA